jgi:thiosulfate/3-mercaptopyruvate sulfurtransferase
VSRERALVDTAWVADRLGAPGIVLVEVDERPLVYRLGHIPGSHCLDWHSDLQDGVTRDLPTLDAMGRMWRRLGVNERSTVVFYGDNSNWYACFGVWLFRLHGLADVRLLDGGRQAWLAEGRPVTTEEPVENVAAAAPAAEALPGFRARWDEAAAAASQGVQLLDVRTPAEYRGDLLVEPGYPQETAQRPGHIPGAMNVPWDVTVGRDGRLLGDEELRFVLRRHGVDLERPAITYCRIGERSAHTWFVLHEILDRPDVRNYDGSWTEWGSMIGMPIALGAEPADPVPLPASPGAAEGGTPHVRGAD